MDRRSAGAGYEAGEQRPPRTGGCRERKGNIDLFDLLGIKIDDKSKQDLVAGTKIVIDQITSIFNESVQSRIDQTQRLIDAIQEQIDEQEEAVAREKELADKGYANNLAVEERKLADRRKAHLKKLRDTAIDKVEKVGLLKLPLDRLERIMEAVKTLGVDEVEKRLTA